MSSTLNMTSGVHLPQLYLKYTNSFLTLPDPKSLTRSTVQNSCYPYSYITLIRVNPCNLWLNFFLSYLFNFTFHYLKIITYPVNFNIIKRFITQK